MSDMEASEEARIVDRALDGLFAACPPLTSPDRDFWAAQFDFGLAWVSFPRGRGGLGLSPGWQVEIDRRIGVAGGSLQNRLINVVGHGMASATLIHHGSEELQERFLRPLFCTDEIWCQLFSEPGSGSDLAGIATSATCDGEEWTVNGQKVWTTLAHEARWGLLLARTDPDVPKHQGLTFFVLDLRHPGVEVRPLYELTGEAEFNEVFLNDVPVPDLHRIGPVGGGWQVALTTLSSERVAAARKVGPRESGTVAMLRKAWESCPERTPARRDLVCRLWIEAEVLRLTSLRASQTAERGIAGPESSTAKLHWAELNKRLTEVVLDLQGPSGMLMPTGYRFVRPTESSIDTTDPAKAFLRSRANSIEGGTSQIMRNILGERVLGLPADVRTDRDVPWRQVPRN